MYKKIDGFLYKTGAIKMEMEVCVSHIFENINNNSRNSDEITTSVCISLLAFEFLCFTL